MAQEGNKQKFGGLKQNLGASLKRAGLAEKPAVNLGIQMEEEKKKGVFVDSVDMSVQKSIEKANAVESGRVKVDLVIPVEPDRVIVTNSVQGSNNVDAEGDAEVEAAKVYLASKDDDSIDMSRYGEVPDEDAYEDVSIEDFGMAMQRGMGWTASAGVGRTNKCVIADVDIQESSFGRLGVGADNTLKRQAAEQEAGEVGRETYEEKRKRTAIEMEKLAVKVERQAMKVGASVEITFGAYKGCFGKVMSLKGTAPEWETAVIKRVGDLKGDTKQYVSVKKGEITVLDEFALPSDHVQKQT